MSPRHTVSAADADAEGRPGSQRLWRAGRTAWAVLGLAAVVLILGYVASRLSLLVVPVLLALFPATLLVPVAGWLKERGVPAAAAALATLVTGILLLVLVIGGLVPIIVAEVPDLVSAAGEGIGGLQDTLQGFGIEIGGVSDLVERAREMAPDAGEAVAQAMTAAAAAFETFAGIVLLLVVLFFYLKDGRRLIDGVISVAPAHLRPHASALADRTWTTLGSFFRGQLLIALVDAVLIGIGLAILRVPLALPLSVLIFFGGLFPVVGAVTSGALAVLVAFAAHGLATALIVLAIVVGVQQLEGNVLEPLILGRAIHLHPLVVLLSITAGAVLLGVLGAFLAVPLAAVVAGVVEYVREQSTDADAPPADQPA